METVELQLETCFALPTARLDELSRITPRYRRRGIGAVIGRVVPMISIVLIDNQTLFREGLRALLEREPDFTVVGEGATGAEACDLARRLKPNVLLFELLIPEVHGLEVLRRLKDQTQTRTVILSAHNNASYVIEALRTGAAGYILKDNSAREVVQAIRNANAGEHYLSKELRNCALELTIGRSTRNGSPRESRLTNRERLVLELAAEGFSSADIARRLSISKRTVESHRTSFMQKLGLKTQTDLVRYAIRHHIITA